MTIHPIPSPGEIELRQRARDRLSVRPDRGDLPATPSAALGVLHQLAASPATADDALALLHELQVHQVELDMQAEELQGTRAELEAELQRQRQLYDSAPVGLFTVGANGVVQQLNLFGASLLGARRETLVGEPLSSYLAAHSARALLAMLERVGGGSRGEGGALELAGGQRTGHVVQASVNADPAGGRFQVAMLDLRGFR